MGTELMKGGIRVDFSGGHPMVSARDLHAALGPKTYFRQWFRRVCDFGFVEGADYVRVLQKNDDSRTGQNELDYGLSVDMAKHICMVQRSEKGMAYRQYFLELEKAWNAPEKVMARALQIANRQISELQARCSGLLLETQKKESIIREMKPKADYCDNILRSDSLMLTTQIAKDYGMSAVRFNNLLSGLGIQYKVRDQWVLYSAYQDKGYTASTTFEVPKSDGSIAVKCQTEWTQKGRRFLYLTLKEKGIIPVIEKQLMEATEKREVSSYAGRSG